MESDTIDSPSSSPGAASVPPATTQVSDQLLFNTQGHFNTFQADLKAINKQKRDVHNRLHSIFEDSEFVADVVDRYCPLPVIV